MSIAIVYNDINPDIVAFIISIGQLYKVKIPDKLIVATPLYYNLILIARNMDDFKRVEKSQTLIPWLYIFYKVTYTYC